MEEVQEEGRREREQHEGRSAEVQKEQIRLEGRARRKEEE